MSACEVFNYRDEPFDTYGLSARQFYRIGKIVQMFLNVHLFLYIFCYFKISITCQVQFHIAVLLNIQIYNFTGAT